MRRWKFRSPLGAIRLHHLLASNPNDRYHDHPWWFLTLVLQGSYVDHARLGDGTIVRDELQRGSIRLRRRHHAHRIETNGPWTLVVTGRQKADPRVWDDSSTSSNPASLTRQHHR
jgi:hypothetical protein